MSTLSSDNPADERIEERVDVVVKGTLTRHLEHGGFSTLSWNQESHARHLGTVGARMIVVRTREHVVRSHVLVDKRDTSSNPDQDLFGADTVCADRHGGGQRRRVGYRRSDRWRRRRGGRRRRSTAPSACDTGDAERQGHQSGESPRDAHLSLFRQASCRCDSGPLPACSGPQRRRPIYLDRKRLRSRKLFT